MVIVMCLLLLPGGHSRARCLSSNKGRRSWVRGTETTRMRAPAWDLLVRVREHEWVADGMVTVALKAREENAYTLGV